jgi:hypothetical protein
MSMLRSFWKVLGCSIILVVFSTTGAKVARSIGLPLKFVLGIFVPQCASGSFAEWFGLKMTEI